ncbi:hypothetical protein DOY81_001569 [Sarcophaga bullata]|nr:hypothetical protein DOY81_001569 [Sarcophaga bullata]
MWSLRPKNKAKHTTKFKQITTTTGATVATAAATTKTKTI